MRKLSSLNKGLVLHCPLNKESYNLTTKRFNDKTPYSNHGTSANAGVFDTDRMGQLDRTTKFNGTSDYIDCGNDDSLRPDDNMTISGWLKTNHDFSATQGTVLCDYNRTTVVGMGLQISVANKLFLFNTRTGGSSRHIISANTINDGDWHHVSCVFVNGSSLKMYVDGVDQGDSTLAGTVTKIYHGVNFVVGVQSTPKERYFDGSIDDTRIYNRALSQDEITLLYESYRSRLII